MNKPKVLFIKPPDRYLDNEFVYQQLGPHYLQSYLGQHGYESEVWIIFEDKKSKKLKVLMLQNEDDHRTVDFEIELFKDFDIVGFSVMSPQAHDAYEINKKLKKNYPHITTVIGGSHARYYKDNVKDLDDEYYFNYIVPYQGWEPMLKIVKENQYDSHRSFRVFL